MFSVVYVALFCFGCVVWLTCFVGGWVFVVLGCVLLVAICLLVVAAVDVFVAVGFGYLLLLRVCWFGVVVADLVWVGWLTYG